MNWLDGEILSWPFLHTNGKWKHSTPNAVESRNSPQADHACVQNVRIISRYQKKSVRDRTWIVIEMKDARPRWYSDERDTYTYVHVYWVRDTSIRASFGSKFKDDRARRNGQRLSHAVMTSFFFYNAGSDCASQNFTTSRKCTLEWAPSLPPAPITFRHGGARWVEGGREERGTNIVFWFRFAHSSRLVSTYACGCVPL